MSWRIALFTESTATMSETASKAPSMAVFVIGLAKISRAIAVASIETTFPEGKYFFYFLGAVVLMITVPLSLSPAAVSFPMIVSSSTTM